MTRDALFGMFASQHDVLWTFFQKRALATLGKNEFAPNIIQCHNQLVNLLQCPFFQNQVDWEGSYMYYEFKVYNFK
jgi:hypothetical protein